MQLSYRGTSYEAQNPAIEVTETERIGLFRGSRFKVQQVNVTQRYAAPSQLKYRGVDYQN